MRALPACGSCGIVIGPHEWYAGTAAIQPTDASRKERIGSQCGRHGVNSLYGRDLGLLPLVS